MSIERSDLDSYFAWLRERTKLRTLGSGWTEITTPYLDRHNDYIQLYGRRSDTKIELSDDGYTVADLERSGCNVLEGRRRILLENTARGFGVEVAGAELRIAADERTFPLKLHSLAQAVLAVDDLFYLARSRVASLFFEDVVEWLNSRDVRYTSRVKIHGRSGFDHQYDFVIPRSRGAPERLVSAINNPNKQSATNFLFAWVDVKDLREVPSKAVAILNDSRGEAAIEEFRAATESYEVTTIPWSTRENRLSELVN